LRCSSQLTPIIPPLEKYRYDENSVFPPNNSCDDNTMNCVAQEEPTVLQEAKFNVPISNEPAKCNHRTSRLKKTF